MDRYVKLERIGRGSYGQVFKIQDKETGEILVAKIINLEDAEVLEDLRYEIQILSQCSSPFIVKYRGSLVSGSRLWILMEYCSGGSLRQMIERMGPLNEEQTLFVAKQIIEALNYLHSQGIVHRDIKAANLLIDANNGRVKLGDFGVAVQLSNCKNMVGTPYWMAPEVIKSNSYDSSADIWSLGITLYELYKGNPPLVHLPPTKAIVLIPQSMPPRLLDPTKKGLSELVNSCLHDDPLQRPNAQYLKKVKCIKGISRNDGILKLLMAYNNKLSSIEPDKQSLLSQRSAFNNELCEYWKFDSGAEDTDGTDENEEEDDYEKNKDTVENSSDFTVIEDELVDNESDRMRSNSITESQLSIETTTSVQEKDPIVQKHKRTPSLISLSCNFNVNEQQNDLMEKLPGIYYDLIIKLENDDERDERFELAIDLKTGRKDINLRGDVKERDLKEKEAYIKERLIKVERAIALINKLL